MRAFTIAEQIYNLHLQTFPHFRIENSTYSWNYLTFDVRLYSTLLSIWNCTEFLVNFSFGLVYFDLNHAENEEIRRKKHSLIANHPCFECELFGQFACRLLYDLSTNPKFKLQDSNTFFGLLQQIHWRIIVNHFWIKWCATILSYST